MKRQPPSATTPKLFNAGIIPDEQRIGAFTLYIVIVSQVGPFIVLQRARVSLSLEWDIEYRHNGLSGFVENCTNSIEERERVPIERNKQTNAILSFTTTTIDVRLRSDRDRPTGQPTDSRVTDGRVEFIFRKGDGWTDETDASEEARARIAPTHARRGEFGGGGGA